ncbi:MAG: hypothetical protein J6L64_01210, partial [Opitutales bacterium]|nr:hypothetical protein [Opitutales bacterium]
GEPQGGAIGQRRASERSESPPYEKWEKACTLKVCNKRRESGLRASARHPVLFRLFKACCFLLFPPPYAHAQGFRT